MPRRSARKEEVSVAAAAAAVACAVVVARPSHSVLLVFHVLLPQSVDSLVITGEARRNPRRSTSQPVVYYQEPPETLFQEEEERNDAMMEETSDNHDDDEEDDDDDDTNNEDQDESLSEDDEPAKPTRKRKSSRNDLITASSPRKSSRSNKYTSSMAESNDNNDLFSEEAVSETEDPIKTAQPRSSNNNNSSSQRIHNQTSSNSPHKSPARRHSEKRRFIHNEEGYTDDDDNDDHEEDGEALDEDAEERSHHEHEEPLKIQRIIASRTERKNKWKLIGDKINTSEITNGSRWIQKYTNEHTDAEDTFEERFLVKWSDLSYLHCSWETRRDLIDQVEGSKTYFSTFFKKSRDGFLFGPDERNDGTCRQRRSTWRQNLTYSHTLSFRKKKPGDYFDPAFTQIDRILEVNWPDDVKHTGYREEAKLTPEDVGVVMDKNDENGTGRQFLVKWGNQPYSESTYEFERDLIWNDIDYKPHVELFLRRNEKPSKRVRKEAINAGKQELRKIAEMFYSQDDSRIEAYKKELEQLEFKNGGQLRDYQAEGVAFMLSNFVGDRSSILADEMGLGKTLQVVVTTNIIATTLFPTAVFLVVAPLSTLTHWKRAFEAWTDLNTIVYHGSAEDRDHIRKLEMAYECDRPARVAFNSLYLKKCLPKKAEKAESPWMVQVIVTTPEMLTADDAAELMAIQYDMVIIDEAHRMKNRNSKLTSVLHDNRFSFKNKVLLTGTPIQNNVSEFWTLLNFCDEESYGDLDDFLAKYGDMKDKETVDQLHDEIRPYILRRLKEDVEKSVPPKEETIIEVELTLPQKQYYRALYERNVKFLYKNKSKALDGPSLNNLAMQLRKCCNHVCLLNGVEDELRRENPELDEADFLIKGSGKLVLLDKLLPRLREEGHRVLIFSQFKIMLDLIEE